MSDTQYFGDISFRAKTGIAIMALEGDPFAKAPRAASTPVTTTDFSQTAWSPWGKNNLMPAEIAEDIENIGILDAALDAKGRIATGKGVQPFLLTNISGDGTEELDWVSDSDIQDFLEENDYATQPVDYTYDRLGYGFLAGSLVLNLGRNKITRIKRHDVYEVRLEKKDSTTRLIPSIYLSSDWKTAGTTYDPKKQTRIDLLEEGYEYADLVNRVANNANKVEYAFVERTLRNGRHYYPQPIYRSNRAWLKIARSVPAFKIAMFKNQITLNYIVTFHPKFWEDKIGEVTWLKYTPEQKKQVREEYESKLEQWLTGEDQAYRTIFQGGFIEPSTGKMTPYITVDVVDNKLKDGHLLPDSGAAVSEILFALMINPSLMGAGNPGGKAYGDTSGGSNVRESFLTQLMLMEAERKAAVGPLNVVKRFNGWSERLEVERTIVSGVNTTATNTVKKMKPRLVFRYQSGLLTTLDTGKSTKAENL